MQAQAQRAAFNTIMAAYKAKGQSPILTQSSLRLEMDLTTAQTNYIFQLLQNEGTLKKCEKRLNQNDAFSITGIAVYLANPASVDDTEFDLLTYPDKGIFTTSGVAAALNGVYNGNLKLTVNGTVFVDAYDILKHKHRPVTQETSTTDPSMVYKDAGVVDCVPYLNISGAKKNIFEMQLPKAVSVIQGITRVVIVLHGFLAQNAASFQV
jgi:hypothetical protein